MKTIIINLVFLFQVALCYSQSNNLVLNQPYLRFSGTGFYSIMPNDLKTDLTLFYADVVNNGTATQTNVSLNVKINNSVSTLFDETGLAVSAIAPDSTQIIYLDSLGLLTFTAPSIYDNYTINYSVNQSETEESPNDNKASINFAVSDTVYARDVENNTDISPQQYGGTDGDFVGTSYYFPINSEVNSMSVFINSNTAIGATIIGKIITGIGTGNITEIIETEYYEVTANDLGKWITIPFFKDGSGEFISQNQLVYVGVECYGNVVIGADSSAIHDFVNESIIRINNIFQSVDKVPLVRLNVAPPFLCLCNCITGATNVSCNGDDDGTANATGSGGTPPYEYIWSNGATTSLATNLSAGVYTVTITDAAFDEIYCSVTINEPEYLGVYLTQNENMMQANAFGGTPPYSYQWITGDTTQSILISSVIGCNVYITVTDASNCNAYGGLFPCAVEQINFIKINNYIIDNQLIIENAQSNNLEIFNIIGTKLLEAKCTEQRATIDVSTLQNGTYVIRLNRNNSFIYRKICIIK